MVAFSGRPLFYQVSVLLLLFASSAFIVALAVPWWSQTYSKISRSITGHSGLWQDCTLSSASPNAEEGEGQEEEEAQLSSAESCHPIEAPRWFQVVQGMQGLALVGMVAACAYTLFLNFCRDHITSSRAVEILAGAGGLLGVISDILYVTKTSPILKHNHGIRYSWAFSTDFAASILVLFISGFIALTNRRPSSGGDDEAVKVIVEDCGGHEVKGTGSRSPEKVKGARSVRGAVKMERSPVRSRRLKAISETFVSLEEEDEDEEEDGADADGKTRPSFRYMNSLGEIAQCDSKTDA